MRILLILGLFLLGFTSQAQTAAEQAQAAYQLQVQQKYPAAIKAYQKLLRKGYQSADLHYNLGLAYYRNQQLGFAILEMEKANRLTPYDRQITKNLELLRNEQADGLPPLPRFFLSDWWLRVAARLTPTTWGIMAIVLLCLAGGALMVRSSKLAAWQPGGKWATWRRWRPIISLGSFVLAVLFVGLALARQAELARTDQGVVTAPVVDLHIAPGDDAAVDFQVHEGLRVRIADNFKGWTKVVLVDGREGWVKADAVGEI
jgi:tetratricopeptide (TPR) repeat protein